MEKDLGLALIGLVVFVVGGLIAVAGVHPNWQNVHNSSPAPLLGNIIGGIGLVIAGLGILLLVVNTVVWAAGRPRSK